MEINKINLLEKSRDLIKNFKMFFDKVKNKSFDEFTEEEEAEYQSLKEQEKIIISFLND